MLCHQELQGCIQEGTTTTGRVEDGNLQQPVTILLQLFQQSLLGLHLSPLVGEIFSLVNMQFPFPLCAETPNGVLHNVFRDVLWRIEHTVLLAFRCLWSLPVVNLLCYLFYLR